MPTKDDDIDAWSDRTAASVQRNMALAEQDRERMIRQRDAARASRAENVLHPRYTDEATRPAPGATALQKALHVLHQPTAKDAPAARAAKKPVERASAAPAARPSSGPITALAGGRDVLNRAGQKGVLVQRVKSFSGHQCSEHGCGLNSAWQLDGRHVCNRHVDVYLNRRAGGVR